MHLYIYGKKIAGSLSILILPILLLSLLLPLLTVSCVSGDPTRAAATDTASEVQNGLLPSNQEGGAAGEAATNKPAAGTAEFNPKEVLTLDPAVLHGSLENGLTYYIRSNKKPAQRLSLRLVVNAGSVLETEEQRGLAHFVEHMAFNGTEEYPKHEIIDYLEKSGMGFGPDINASTSFEQTIYELDLPTENPERLRTGIDILKEWAFHIAFEPEEVNKERQVIIEEWRGGRDASARLRDKYLPVLFRGSPYADRMPIGLVEVIESSSASDLREFYKTWYVPQHMAVIAVGDIDPAEIEFLIKEIFEPEGLKKSAGIEGASAAGARASGGNGVRPSFSIPPQENEAFVVATDPEARRSSVQVTRIHGPLDIRTAGDFRRSLATAMYREMISSRLREKTQQANPPFISAFFSIQNLLRNNGATLWAASAMEGRTEQALRELLIEDRRVRLHGFSETELTRAKENIRSWMKRQYDERDKTESGRFIGEYVSHFLDGQAAPGIEKEWELARSLLPQISLEEVHATGEGYLDQAGEYTVTVTGPEKEGLNYPTEKELREVLSETAAIEVGPYRDELAGEELVPFLSTPGKIVSEKSFPEEDYHRFDLDNGARIFYKKTDFRNEQVLFTAFSPGGASMVEDSDYFAARLAPSLIDAGGLGEFTPTQLQKLLAGSQVNVTPYIHELYEGFSGSGRPEDMEKLFQLLYLYFTDVREDEALFSSYQTRLADLLENRLSDPQTVLGDRVTSLLFEDHPRRQPLDAAAVGTITPDQVYRIFRDRFGSPSDFTFVFTGNVDPDRLKELAARYLGPLPEAAGAPKEKWIDRQVRFTRDNASVEVNVGLENKSTVYRIFPVRRPWSLEDRTALQALEQLVDIRLRETVREDAGGTYGVGVSIISEKEPLQRAMLSVNFSCDPGRVEELNGIIDAELKRLRTAPVGKEYAEKIRNILLKSLEEARETNGYWMDGIAEAQRLGLATREVFAEEQRIRAISPERLRATAESFFRDAIEVRGVLYPEE